MLINMDKGSYSLNTDNVEALGHYSGVRHGEKAYFADVVSGNRWNMTKKDHDRIVAAMSNKEVTDDEQ
ncbi:hypothetical protein [Lacticaseibacillus paracasei]|uniref:Uncharacterized protein n=1 Tax=Lacticaseibacillus paracasei TaxID=1597 RepID=A0A8B3GQ85_LACPA|nr:hypothetical protein [Lacticaseibacillus paracasei]MBM6414003.1 hypothetical protein [Lacticaseibacillus paracasei]RNE28553.1 hypothetical protein FAM6012_02255 [Lacticaseibacillus paracasei]